MPKVVPRLFWSLTIACTTVGILAFANKNFERKEYFSSVDRLQKLTAIERELVQNFRDYLNERKNELEYFSGFIDHIKQQHNKANKNVKEYTINPINAFTMIKRLVEDWNNLHFMLKQSEAREYLNERMKKLPGDNELKGAINGISRLQKVYHLDAYDISNGKLNNVHTGTVLSWSDCFEIATSLFDEKEFLQAMPWFELVLEKLYEIRNNEEDDILLRFKIETLEYLALSSYELGNSEVAVDYIDAILKLDPNHHSRNCRSYLISSTPKDISTPNSFQFYYTEDLNYTRLCRGIQTPQKELRNLKCTVETRGNTHFLIAPLKVEELCKDPEIKVYHELLTDIQVDDIYNEARYHMKRSKFGNNFQSTASEIRVSQQAWVEYGTTVMRSVKHLLEEITGLDMANGEDLQVANYGIGGHYSPHYDIFLPYYDNIRYLGNRFMMNIFYLSDVKEGGFTVFPHINVFARPVKGSMISWYNLHKSLEPDYRVFHAGCPVVLGSKRIGNVWIHSGFQELRRPCDLENDAYKSSSFKPYN